jgi:hypothetical protein
MPVSAELYNIRGVAVLVTAGLTKHIPAMTRGSVAAAGGTESW